MKGALWENVRLGTNQRLSIPARAVPLEDLSGRGLVAPRLEVRAVLVVLDRVTAELGVGVEDHGGAGAAAERRDLVVAAEVVEEGVALL